MINKERLTKNFLKLLSFNSPPGKEKEIANYLNKKLKKLGLSSFIDKNFNVFARKNGLGEPFLLSAHTDTVEPTPNQVVEIKNGKFKTDGKTILGADDKAGIAVILEVLESLIEDKKNTVPLEIVFTSSEEIGLVGALNFNFKKLKAKKGLVLDLGWYPGRCATNAPCYLRFDIDVIGKASHSALPQNGINALKIVSESLALIKLGNLDKKSCANFGVINGGSSRNIVPEKISLLGEVRSYDHKKAIIYSDKMIKIFKKIAKKYKGKIKINRKLEFKGYSFTKKDDILNIYKKACEKCGVDFLPSPSKGGSDANIFNSKGIKVLDVSVGTIGAHSKKENIKLKDMIKSCEIIYKCLEIISK